MGVNGGEAGRMVFGVFQSSFGWPWSTEVRAISGTFHVLSSTVWFLATPPSNSRPIWQYDISEVSN